MSMGDYTTIMARDGHEFQAWLTASPAKARGAVVVIQEIFGVNAHIRGVTDDFAAQGYTAIAPCLFDRVRRGIELEYTPAEVQEGAGYFRQLKPESMLKDLAAAVAVVRSSGRVGTVGYCAGGALSYVAACQLPVSCAVAYYGKIANYLDQKPKCPVMYHFGSEDTSIPMSDVDKVKAAADARAVFYLYQGAGHGFNCDRRASFDAAAAALARTRTLDFLAHNLRGDAS
jgi:carboxymethylenebutenolidase